MVFLSLLVLFVMKDKVEGEGMAALGIAGFFELATELAMLGAYLHL